MELKKIPEIGNPSLSSFAYNRCFHCHSEWSPRTDECPECGRKLKFESGLTKTYDFKICLHCHGEWPPRFNECPNCGGKLIIKDGRPERSSSFAYNTCSKCNTKWSPRSQNCPTCGSKLIFTEIYFQTYITPVI